MSQAEDRRNRLKSKLSGRMLNEIEILLKKVKSVEEIFGPEKPNRLIAVLIERQGKDPNNPIMVCPRCDCFFQFSRLLEHLQRDHRLRYRQAYRFQEKARKYKGIWPPKMTTNKGQFMNPKRNDRRRKGGSIKTISGGLPSLGKRR